MGNPLQILVSGCVRVGGPEAAIDKLHSGLRQNAPSATEKNRRRWLRTGPTAVAE